MKNLHEVFEEFEKAPDRQAKIDVLRRNNSFALKSVLQGAFDPRIKFIFRTPVRYTPMTKEVPADMGYTTIHTELDRVYLYMENHPRKDPNLKPQRIEQILQQVLEAMVAPEAAIFMGMLLKKLPVKGLTEKIVREAFPDILPTE